jgi:phosphohistidine phosphatase
MASKQLVLVRHAKSSWADSTLADRDRPLNERGQEAAALVGRHLRAEGLHPDLVLCSSAMRARQTLARMDIASDATVRVEDELYAASAADLRDRVQQVSSQVGCLVLIGHNPAIEDLARMLTGDGLASMQKFPTGAVVDLDLPIRGWAELGGGVGQLREIILPRALG